MTKSNKTISPLRQRMLEDMAIRKLADDLFSIVKVGSL